MADHVIPRNDPGIAGFARESWQNSPEPLYGEGALTTTHMTVKSTAGIDLPLYSVVHVAADGEITKAAYASGASNAQYVLGVHLVLGAGDTMSAPVYREGHFDQDALVWAASFDTDAKKQHAFEGSVSPTIFVSKKNFKDDAIPL